jgi:hypothetical protein
MQRTAQLSFVSVLLAAASPAAAQRSLHWEELAVSARLGADGRLHVTETQTMVLSGDWNGGERRFRLRPEQELELHRVRRLDPATGAWLSLRQGSLDSVDADERTRRRCAGAGVLRTRRQTRARLPA